MRQYEKYWHFILLSVWLTAVTLRLIGLNWDNYNHYHPDERYISWVASSIAFSPPTIATLQHPQQATANPYYWPAEDSAYGVVVPLDEPRKFAYGHLPLYMGVIATRVVEQIASQHQIIPPAPLAAHHRSAQQRRAQRI